MLTGIMKRRRPKKVTSLIARIFFTLFFLIGTAQSQNLQLDINDVNGSGFPDVSTFLTVINNGQTIGGLTENDFEAYEDGTRELPITVVELTDDSLGVNVMLVIDRSTSMLGERMAAAIQAAQTFVDLMAPKDKAAVISFNSNSNLEMDFSNDKTALKNKIGAITAFSGTAMYDALIHAGDVVEPVEGRKAIILLSDGDDRHSSSTLQQAIARVKPLSVPVFTVGLGVNSSARDDLTQIAQQTNGQYYETPDASDLEDIYRAISALLHHSYIVSYSTHNAVADGTIRQVEIVVNTMNTAASDTGSYRAPLEVAPFSLTSEEVPVPSRNFTVDLVVPKGGNSVYNMKSMTTRVYFPKEFMQVLNSNGFQITPGTFLGSAGTFDFDFTVNTTEGYIDFDISKTVSDSVITGQGTLAQITFSMKNDVPDATEFVFHIETVEAFNKDNIQLVTSTDDLVISAYGPVILAVAAEDTIKPGKSFKLLIEIPDHSKSVSDLKNLGFSLGYDTTYFNVATPLSSALIGGDLLGVGTDHKLSPTVRSNVGAIDFNITKNDGAALIQGKGRFLEIEMVASKTLPDSTPVQFTLSQASAHDDAGWEIPVTIENLDATSYGVIVWPGDLNNNGKVELADVNFLGVYWGLDGPGRYDTKNTLDWNGQYAARYPVRPSAFVDSDGSGTIDERDLIAIGMNWERQRNAAHVALKSAVSQELAAEGEIEIEIREDMSTQDAYRLRLRLVSSSPATVRGFTFRVQKQSNIDLIGVVTGNLWQEKPLFYSQQSDNHSEIAACMVLRNGAAEHVEDGILAEVIIMSKTKPTADQFTFSRVGLIGQNGRVTEKSLGATTGVDENELPVTFKVHPAYPNPFNPSTSIQYSVPEQADVQIYIFNTSGQQVITYENRHADSGTFTWMWHGRSITGATVSSGIYFIRVVAVSQSGKIYKSQQSVTLIK